VQPVIDVGQPAEAVVRPVVDIARPALDRAVEPVRPAESAAGVSGVADPSPAVEPAAPTQVAGQVVVGASGGNEQPEIALLARLFSPDNASRTGQSPPSSAGPSGAGGYPEPAPPLSPGPATPVVAVLAGPGCGATANGGTGGAGGGGACAAHATWPSSLVATGDSTAFGGSVGPRTRPHDTTISPD